MSFDLEKARAADEVLPYPLDAKEIWVSGKGQMHINLPNAPSIFFTLSDLCEFRNIFHGQAAEIERLRDENAFLEKVIHKKNIRLNELEDALEADAEQSEICIRARLDVIDQQAAQIKELEGREEDLFTCYNCGKKVDDVETGPVLGEIHFDPGYPGGEYEPPEPAVAYFVCTDCLKTESKIEPDVDAKPHCWQITDERILAIENAISSCVLIERYTGQDLQHETAVLRTMLGEVK